MIGPPIEAALSILGQARDRGDGVPTTTFRLAHVSDLHLAEQPAGAGLTDRSTLWRWLVAYIPGFFKRDYRPWMNSYDLDYLRALTRSLRGKSYYNVEPYDAYVFSGDLATTGLPQDMAVAAAYIRGKPIFQFSSGELTIPPEKTVVLPGNHDRYEGKTLRPKSKEFERGKNFGAKWTFDDGDTSPPVRAAVNWRVLEKGDVRLGVVCGDFSYTMENSPRIPLLYLGGGFAADATLEEMCRVTARLHSEGTPCIWAVHHAPISRGTGATLRLDGAHRVGDAAYTHGVRFILCGHTHIAGHHHYAKTSYRDRRSRVRVICAGSATSWGQGHRSYYEISFRVTSAPHTPSVRAMVVREMRAKPLGIRGQDGHFARKFEFAPLRPRPV